MSDLIKRSDAIEAIEETDWYHINRDGDLVSGARSDGTALYKAGDVYKALEAVPSARPNGELKSCPFCGWGTIVDIPFLLQNKHICKCNACGARTKKCRTWEDAVKLWNMRKGADDEMR